MSLAEKGVWASWGRQTTRTLQLRNVFLGRECKAIVRAHTVFVRKLMHSCPIVSAGDLLWAHPSYPPSGRGQGARSQAVGGPTAKGERQPGESPAESCGKVPRAGPHCPRRAQDAARPGVLPRGEGKRVWTEGAWGCLPVQEESKHR